MNITTHLANLLLATIDHFAPDPTSYLSEHTQLRDHIVATLHAYDDPTTHDTNPATNATTPTETQPQTPTGPLRDLVDQWREAAQATTHKATRDDLLTVAMQLEQILDSGQLRPFVESPYAHTPWAREHEQIEPQPLEGWLTEVNTGDIHPREAARLLDELFTRVATQHGWPGVSATLKLLGDLHRDLLVAAKGADRDYPEEALAPGPGRIEVGPPYVDGRVTIDPVHGVRAQGKDGEVFHMPAEGGFHRDVAGKHCKADPLVVLLQGQLERTDGLSAPDQALEVAAWLADQGLLANPPERA